MPVIEKKRCEVCNEEMIGRQDKRFCSDSCRSTFHNQRNSDHSNFIRNINNRLRKNRRILAELNPKGMKTVHRDKLLEAGFNFRYFTNEYVTLKEENVYRFVYDHGYREMEDGMLMLVIRQEYVE